MYELMTLADKNKTVKGTDMNERSSRSHTVLCVHASTYIHTHVRTYAHMHTHTHTHTHTNTHTHRYFSCGSRQYAGPKRCRDHCTWWTSQVRSVSPSPMPPANGSKRRATSTSRSRASAACSPRSQRSSSTCPSVTASSPSSCRYPNRTHKETGTRTHTHIRTHTDNKPTSLLQPCLSANGKAMVLMCASPAATSSHETLCTLRFAALISQCQLAKPKRCAFVCLCVFVCMLMHESMHPCSLARAHTHTRSLMLVLVRVRVH